MIQRIPAGVFFALFTVSGFAGLIYESIWSHYLKLFLGHAAYAQTLVLAIFMGGMAAGSWLVSRFTHRIPNLLLGYAVAEFGIGLLALAFDPLFRAGTGWAFATVLPALGGSAAIDLFKWSLAALFILPAAMLLGTTFPLMSGGILRLFPESSARALAMLYFTNSLGAALGVLASGFLLIDHLGLPGTILTAGVLNIVLALGVWLIARHREAPPGPPPSAAAGDGGGRFARAVLVLAAVTGAASFIYEVTWIRMLSMGLGSSTHSFEVMLAAFILGMSLGAWWLRGRIGVLRNDMTWLSGLLVAKAASAVYALWAYDGVLELTFWTLQAVARNDSGYAITSTAGLVASMLVMFPTAFCAGMTLPLATHALTSRGFGEASIGRVYGANTAGCIVGAAFATHVGMEWLGLKGLTGLGALLDLSMAFGLAALAAGAASRRRTLAVTAVVAAAGGVAFHVAQFDYLRMDSGVFRHGRFDDPATSRVVFHRDGKTATIAVVDTLTKRSIRTNGKTDASIERAAGSAGSIDEHTMMLAGAIPLAMKPEAQWVANIGLGSGLTTHTLLGSPRVREVDTIEIERMVVEGARLFAPRNARAYNDPRSRIHIEDAKTFFAAHGRHYDVIVSEPSNPWVSGVSTLFSEEFYAQIRRHLKPDGVFVQWVQAYEMNVGLLSSILQAVARQFGDYTVYNSGVGDLFVIATPARALPALKPDLFAMPGLAADLAALGYVELADLEALRVGGRRVLEPLFARTGFPANSDYFPVLDQHAPRSRFKGESADALPRLRDTYVPALALLDGERRTSLARLRRMTLNHPARLERTLAGAEAIGVFLGGPAGLAVSLPAADRTQAAVAHALLGGCAQSRDLWLAALSRVLELSLPYVERSEVKPVFDTVRQSKCWKELAAGSRRWVDYLEAVNDRDAGAIGQHAEALLEALPPSLEGERAELVLSAMVASLALGQPERALALRERHGAHLKRADRDSLLARLVDAQLAPARPVPRLPK